MKVPHILLLITLTITLVNAGCPTYSTLFNFQLTGTNLIPKGPGATPNIPITATTNLQCSVYCSGTATGALAWVRRKSTNDCLCVQEPFGDGHGDTSAWGNGDYDTGFYNQYAVSGKCGGFSLMDQQLFTQGSQNINNLLQLFITCGSACAGQSSAAWTFEGPQNQNSWCHCMFSNSNWDESALTYTPGANFGSWSPIITVPTFVGCFGDASTRAIPGGPGTIMTWAQCRDSASAAGSNIFALQYPNGSTTSAYCFHGKNANYSKYGSFTCPSAQDAAGHKLGGSWINAVYAFQQTAV